MNDRFKWTKLLNRLLHDNFHVARSYRKTAEAMPDVSLKHYFQKRASKRSQFAIELDQEITFLGGNSTVHDIYPITKKPFDTSEASAYKLIKMCVKLNKKSIKDYQQAISEVNEGSSREILFRHRAKIQEGLIELKTLRSIMKDYQREELPEEFLRKTN